MREFADSNKKFSVLNLKTGEFEYYFTESLFESKSKASDYYLINRSEQCK